MEIPKEVYDDSYGFESKRVMNWVNKQRTLVVASRTLTSSEYRVFEDFKNLLPHSKTDSKIEKKEIIEQLDFSCEMKHCQNLMYFEKRGKNCYLYIAKHPEGPTIKYLIKESNQSEDTRFLGNCLKGSRPILVFSNEFSENDVFKIQKNLWVDLFNVPKNHPKSQPFIDKVFSFQYDDGLIYLRNYQILKKDLGGKKMELIEIGPRMTLQLIRIFSDFLGGKTLYLNPQHKSNKMLRLEANERFKKIHKMREEKKSKKEETTK